MGASVCKPLVYLFSCHPPEVLPPRRHPFVEYKLYWVDHFEERYGRKIYRFTGVENPFIFHR
jgi:hypothetical protein